MFQMWQRNQKCAILWKWKEGWSHSTIGFCRWRGQWGHHGEPHQEGRSSLVVNRRGEARCTKLRRGLWGTWGSRMFYSFERSTFTFLRWGGTGELLNFHLFLPQPLQPRAASMSFEDQWRLSSEPNYLALLRNLPLVFKFWGCKFCILKYHRWLVSKQWCLLYTWWLTDKQHQELIQKKEEEPRGRSFFSLKKGHDEGQTWGKYVTFKCGKHSLRTNGVIMTMLEIWGEWCRQYQFQNCCAGAVCNVFRWACSVELWSQCNSCASQQLGPFVLESFGDVKSIWGS